MPSERSTFPFSGWRWRKNDELVGWSVVIMNRHLVIDHLLLPSLLQNMVKWNHIWFENTQGRIPQSYQSLPDFLLWWHLIEKPFFDLVTWTSDLWPLNLTWISFNLTYMPKLKSVCHNVCSFGQESETDRHTEGQCQNYYTRHWCRV